MQSARSTRLSAHAHAKHLTQQSSEIGDERPISGCAFSPNGAMLATCGESYWIPPLANLLPIRAMQPPPYNSMLATCG